MLYHTVSYLSCCVILCHAIQAWFDLANTEDEQKALELGGRSPVMMLEELQVQQ
jgi:hypothetical protein